MAISHIVGSSGRLARHCSAPAWAQFKEGEPSGNEFGKSQTMQWQIGLVIKAIGRSLPGRQRLHGRAHGLARATGDGPQGGNLPGDQDPRHDPGKRCEDHELEDWPACQLVGRPRHSSPLKSAGARFCRPRTPTSTCCRIPKKLLREMRPYLVPSPRIESRNPKIRDLAEKIGEGEGKGVGEGRGDLRLGARTR